MQRILIAIDFSDISGTVLNAGMDLAQSLGAEVRLIHVAEPKPFFVDHEVDPPIDRDMLAQQFRAEHEHLREMADRVQAAGVTVTPLLVQGPTVEKILDEAGQFGASMIVMGTHGHGALYEALVGSVSSGVLRKAPCPVMMVPAGARA